MELRVLLYFLTVAQEENITKAAKILHVTQPSLSRQLRQLEEEFQVQLFYRHKHGIVLTEDGHLLRRRAQEIVSLAEKTEEELSHREELISGQITLGCGETENMVYVSQKMALFRKKYPEVHFEIYTAVADAVQERLENGSLDFGLLQEPVDVTPYQYLRLPVKENWSALMRKDFPLAPKTKLTPADLVGVPLILPKRRSVQNVLANWFGEYYPQLNVAGVYNLSYHNCLILVRNRLGLALVHEFKNCPPDLCLRPLAPAIGNRSVLIWKKNQVLSPLVRTFIDCLKHTD